MLPALALAGPRSGGSFSGRRLPLGRRLFSTPRSYSSPGYGYGGGGIHFIFLPGWGWGGGYGYGGGGLFGTLVVLAVGRLRRSSHGRARGAARAPGRRRRRGACGAYTDDDEAAALPGRAYLYRLQLALGRSARGIQERLAEFAANGDTESEAGLAALLQQTALELLREKDSIRYVGADGARADEPDQRRDAMNGMALAERSRFQVERVRAADGRVSRASDAAAEEGGGAGAGAGHDDRRHPHAAASVQDRHARPKSSRPLLAELGGVSRRAVCWGWKWSGRRPIRMIR